MLVSLTGCLPEVAAVVANRGRPPVGNSATFFVIFFVNFNLNFILKRFRSQIMFTDFSLGERRGIGHNNE